MSLEDADDQLRPVNDGNAARLLQYPGLGARQLIVGDHEPRTRLLYHLAQLVALATPEIACAIPAALLEYAGNLDPKGARQPP